MVQQLTLGAFVLAGSRGVLKGGRGLLTRCLWAACLRRCGSRFSDAPWLTCSREGSDVAWIPSICWN